MPKKSTVKHVDPRSQDDIDLDNAALLPDPLVEEEPTELDLEIGKKFEELETKHGSEFLKNFVNRKSVYDAVKWPSFDKNSPDYGHVDGMHCPGEFDLSADVLDRLISLNLFEPYQDKGAVAFALRGAKLVSGMDAEKVPSVRVEVTRPDHINFNCLIGIYHISTRTISVYVGSTVPCRKAIFNYPNGGSKSNLLPNGLYSYYIWRHKTIKPALRLSQSNKTVDTLEAGQPGTVLRSKNDYVLGTRDVWDPDDGPLDNVHCSYYTTYVPDLGSYYSSWGCLTIRGKKTGTDQWGKFQKLLSNIGSKARVDLILLTGKDAALASLQLEDDATLETLVRLRVGSRGDPVSELQKRLNLKATSVFDYQTRFKLTEYQRQMTATDPSADGIYSPAMDAATGWGILTQSSNVSFALRALPPEDFDDSKSLPSPTKKALTEKKFKLEPANEPQEAGKEFYATEIGTTDKFYVAKSTKYVSRRGLVRSSTLLTYDRHQAENDIGLWAHFMWPTVMGESKGRHITINTYDRAAFTWGFFQLAAHTARDNLILLMRELIQLPSAKAYFPDLKLVNGRVHQATAKGDVDLEFEKAVDVGKWTEIQIPRFMAYLNPNSYKINNVEILNAARFVHWTLADPDVVKTTVDVSLGILRRKAKGYGTKFDLIGRRPELAIWVCDMFHQGRGSVQQAKAALKLPTFSAQLEALSRIDTTGMHEERLKTVKEHVDELIDEKRFDGIRFGDPELDP